MMQLFGLGGNGALLKPQWKRTKMIKQRGYIYICKYTEKGPETKDMHLQNFDNYHELIHDDISATPTTTPLRESFGVVLPCFSLCNHI